MRKSDGLDLLVAEVEVVAAVEGPDAKAPTPMSLVVYPAFQQALQA